MASWLSRRASSFGSHHAERLGSGWQQIWWSLSPAEMGDLVGCNPNILPPMVVHDGLHHTSAPTASAAALRRWDGPGVGRFVNAFAPETEPHKFKHIPIISCSIRVYAHE